MSIVLDEYTWAKNAIKEKQLGKVTVEGLGRVAKYHLSNGMSKKETRVAIEKLLLECVPGVSLVRWSDTLDRTMKYAAKYPPIRIDGIRITKKEMTEIQNLKGIQFQRVAFALLCLAKYNIAVSGNKDGWVNYPHKEITSLANSNVSIDKRCEMLAQMKDLNMIRLSKRIDSRSLQVLFVDNEGTDTELLITDFRNLGYQYMKYLGGSFLVCECCGITVPMNNAKKKSVGARADGRKQKYCPSCAAKIAMKQNVESVMRGRKTAKIS